MWRHQALLIGELNQLTSYSVGVTTSGYDYRVRSVYQRHKLLHCRNARLHMKTCAILHRSPVQFFQNISHLTKKHRQLKAMEQYIENIRRTTWISQPMRNRGACSPAGGEYTQVRIQGRPFFLSVGYCGIISLLC